jgi:transposase
MGGESRLAREASSWKEGRRLRALDLDEKGWTQTMIAEALGVTKSAVNKWLKSARMGGRAALRRKSRHGQATRLSEEQLLLLPHFLELGPSVFGFSGELWTCPRIARVIAHEFGVEYHPDHVRRLMHRLHWSYQKPIVRASERDEKLVVEWLEHGWLVVKKGLKGRTG